MAAGHEFEYPVYWGCDLATEHERFLTEQHFKRPVFVTDYPAEIKAFYMRMNDDGKTVAAADCLVPGIGEIIGGSQREERLDLLEARIRELGMNPEDYWWYLDLRIPARWATRSSKERADIVKSLPLDWAGRPIFRWVSAKRCARACGASLWRRGNLLAPSRGNPAQDSGAAGRTGPCPIPARWATRSSKGSCQKSGKSGRVAVRSIS